MGARRWLWSQHLGTRKKRLKDEKVHVAGVKARTGQRVPARTLQTPFELPDGSISRRKVALGMQHDRVV